MNEKFTKDIIIKGGECYLKAWDIDDVIEHDDYFEILFGYNPEGETDGWRYYKGDMTYAEIKAFKKWLLKDGIKCQKPQPQQTL